jgi:hypothetical protein
MALLRCANQGPLGLIYFRGQSGSDEDCARMNERAIYVLTHHACPDCAGPMAAKQRTHRVGRVVDDGFSTYRCADPACNPEESWSYQFDPGSAKRAASGEAIPLRTKTDWRTGRTEGMRALSRMVETETCPLCTAPVRVVEGVSRWPDEEPRTLLAYECTVDGCGMRALVPTHALRQHVRELVRALGHFRSVASALADASDECVVQVVTSKDRTHPHGPDREGEPS